MTDPRSDNPRGTTRLYSLAILAGLAFTLSAGYLYGRFTQRWGPPPDLQGAATHLETLPESIGTWQLTEELEMEPGVVDMLECAGYAVRSYTDRASGASIKLMIIVGPPGPTAVHTPEICYSSRSHELQGDAEEVIFGDSATGSPSHPAHGLWHVSFKPKGVVGNDLHVYYGWSTGEVWEASESPRFEYAGQPLLYKIQIAGEVPPQVTSGDPAKKFLDALFLSDWKLRN